MTGGSTPFSVGLVRYQQPMDVVRRLTLSQFDPDIPISRQLGVELRYCGFFRRPTAEARLPHCLATTPEGRTP